MKISAQTMSSNSKVVIIGGGFRELYTGRTTANQPVDVTLTERTNHHLFRLLLAKRISCLAGHLCHRSYALAESQIVAK
jgi:NADH dehydrogenase FAD-containing subunit